MSLGQFPSLTDSICPKVQGNQTHLFYELCHASVLSDSVSQQGGHFCFPSRLAAIRYRSTLFPSQSAVTTSTGLDEL